MVSVMTHHVIYLVQKKKKTQKNVEHLIQTVPFHSFEGVPRKRPKDSTAALTYGLNSSLASYRGKSNSGGLPPQINVTLGNSDISGK